MKLERALRDDLPAVDEILRQGRNYLSAQGLDQWQKFAPVPEETRAFFARGEQYVVRENNEVAGVCVIVDDEPAYRTIEGAWRCGGRYVAVHRVAVSPVFRRRGVASALFAGAARIARERGARSVRIDTHEGNIPMRTALEKNGFCACGTVVIATGEMRIAYEKEVEGMKVVAATGNAHKLKEMRAIFPAWEIVAEGDAGFFGEVEETGGTFAENALIKARAVCAGTGLPALADDSGLCVGALGGAPGVRSARYSGGDDAANRALLIKNLSGAADRSAYFCCAVALVFPDGRTLTAEGKTYGSIAAEERGAGGFGYDSLFISDDLGKTFAEASEAEKNAVSHRGRALAALEKLL